MLPVRLYALPLLALLAVTACAPAALPNGQSGNRTQSGQPIAAHTLVMVTRVEPGAATPRVDQSGGVAMDVASRLFTAALTYQDEREVPKPYLAEALPELNTNSWRVFPDGRTRGRR